MPAANRARRLIPESPRREASPRPAGHRAFLIPDISMQSIIHRWMAQAVPFIPRVLLQRVSRRYVAGETLADAVACVRRLAMAGCTATVDITHSRPTGSGL